MCYGFDNRGHLNCVTFLVSFGVNLYSVDIDGHSAQELAAMNDQIQVLSFLDSAAAHLESSDTKKARRYLRAYAKKLSKFSLEGVNPFLDMLDGI